MATTINNSNIFSESYRIIKNFLEDTLTDPRHRFKANWIHSSLPHINSKSFSGYPFIVIQTDISENTKSFDLTSEKKISATITIYSDEATEIDSLADQIYGSLHSSLDFKSTELSSSPLDWTLDQNGKKILRRTIGVIGKVRL